MFCGIKSIVFKIKILTCLLLFHSFEKVLLFSVFSPRHSNCPSDSFAMATLNFKLQILCAAPLYLPILWQ